MDKNRELIWDMFLLTVFTIFVMFCMSSCRTKYVSVPEYHTEYVVKCDTTHLQDSVYIHDSVYMVSHGDTVEVAKYLFRDRYRYIYKNTNDTVLANDTVKVLVPTEKQLTKAERRYITLGKFVYRGIWAMLIAALAAFVVYYTLKKRQRVS